jgi:uncharacterized membrane protein YraQ (UPF0718 family)
MNGTQKLSLWVIASIWAIWMVASGEWLVPTLTAAVFAFLIYQSLTSVQDAAAWATRVTRGAIISILSSVILALVVGICVSVSRAETRAEESKQEIRRHGTNAHILRWWIISTTMRELVEEAKRYTTLRQFMKSVSVKIEPEQLQAMGLDDLDSVLVNAYELAKSETGGHRVSDEVLGASLHRTRTASDQELIHRHEELLATAQKLFPRQPSSE